MKGEFQFVDENPVKNETGFRQTFIIIKISNRYFITKQWEEIEPELRRAREELSTTWKDKRRTASGTFVPVEHTWAGYCEDINMTKRHANRLLAAKK